MCVYVFLSSVFHSHQYCRCLIQFHSQIQAACAGKTKGRMLHFSRAKNGCIVSPHGNIQRTFLTVFILEWAQHFKVHNVRKLLLSYHMAGFPLGRCSLFRRDTNPGSHFISSQQQGTCGPESWESSIPLLSILILP